MRVGEWMDNDLRVQEVMQQISRMLNSNERFQLDDSFSLHISHIRDPGRRSGNKRIKKATMVLEKLLDVKKSVVKIENDDELCCARAIVTMKAYCDFGSRDSRYRNLQQGKPAQGREAKTLHCAAGVPEGPCSLPEIDTFQKHLTEYQIVVLSLDHMYQIIFKGPPRDKHIILIKVGNHYHGCNSLSGFLGSVYFCIECETSYKQDDYSHHPCKGKKCHACHQTGCVDFAPGQIPCHQCPRCQRAFFGEQCMGNHYVYSTTDGKRADIAKKIKNVCSTVRKCKNCNRLLPPHEIETRDVCGTAECPSCKKIPQSSNSPMLHSESRQVRGKEEITQIQKTQSRRYAQSRRKRVVGEMRVRAQTLIQCNQCSQASYAKTSPTLISVATHPTLKNGPNADQCSHASYTKNGLNAIQCSHASYAKKRAQRRSV